MGVPAGGPIRHHYQGPQRVLPMEPVRLKTTDGRLLRFIWRYSLRFVGPYPDGVAEQVVRDRLLGVLRHSNSAAACRVWVEDAGKDERPNGVVAVRPRGLDTLNAFGRDCGHAAQGFSCCETHNGVQYITLVREHILASGFPARLVNHEIYGHAIFRRTDQFGEEGYFGIMGRKGINGTDWPTPEEHEDGRLWLRGAAPLIGG